MFILMFVLLFIIEFFEIFTYYVIGGEQLE